MQGRATRRCMLTVAVVLMLWALPVAVAQERPPTQAQSGTHVLGRSGTPGYIFHQFLFRLATSDLVIVKFQVTPVGARTVFTFHLHPATGGILEILNVTSDNYSSPFNVPTDGLYAPQWVNHNPFAVNLTYAVLVYSNGVGIGLPNIPTILLLLVGGLGGAAGGLEAFLWWRNRRQGRQA